ncbi:hypothetical protein SAMN05428944_7472 [Streptomyces sp. 1222.5]|uniref:hypothetical protein n=1 Tax=unclassified Streptomyces TaxID=2593676 RepID=UPI00089C6B71|nr:MULTISPECIES: hypothetical protein [unclassified Streptomyces]PKW05503.1 hypothetical protein BX260_0619 [Streptomyces sp. 5112.2]SED37434.1 hypothetical protein SAMN05428944_7472 [Streptomyces sp. 1222.5]
MSFLSFPPEDLFPGEHIVLQKNANAVIDVRESGLSRFAFDDLMWLVGMDGKEAIGGRAFLTNYRLVFKAHSVNRMRGSFSVFLPSVLDVRNSSVAVTRKATLTTALQELTLVLWGVPRFIDAVRTACTTLGAEQVRQLIPLVLAEPWKAGDGLKTAVRLEQLNRVLNMARGGAEFDAERLAAAVAGLIDGSCGRTDTAVVLGVVDLLRSAYRGGL